MTRARFFQTRLPASVAVALLLAAPQAVHAQEDGTDTTRLIQHLEVQPGMHIAEIGAGTGTLTVAMARAVGPTGHVFSNEINAERHPVIRAAVEAAGLTNVTIVASGAADANLPHACCDAVFMRNVYHHFDDPTTMNASLARALRPGGRLAVIDFPPRGGTEAATPADRDQGSAHGVTPASVARELRAAGLEVVLTDEPGGARWFMVVGCKPVP